MSKAMLVLSAMLLLTSLGAIDRTVLLTEDFSSNQFPPAGWSISEHPENWSIVQTALCGGVVPELKFGWYPIFTGSSYFISPVINTEGSANLLLDFRQLYDYHDPGPSISVVTRSGDGPWSTVWNASPNTNLAAYMYTVEIANADAGSATFQFAFCFEGNSFHADGWFFDDIKLYKIDTSDLLVSAAMPDSQVTSGTEVEPWAMIRNQGNFPIVAKASMQIYHNDNLIESWPSFWIHNMAPQAEERVSFPTFSAASPNSCYRIKFSVSSQEGTVDDNLSNNQLFCRINTWNTPKQKVLLELGTGIWNPEMDGCYGAIIAADQFLANDYPVAILNHMLGPPYACDDSEIRIRDYNITHLPTAVFDGTRFSEASSSTASVYDSYLPLYEAAAGVKAPFNLELRGDFVAPEYFYQVLIDKTAYTDSLNCRLHLVLSKDNQLVNWMGLDNLDHVTWDFVADMFGIELELGNSASDDLRYNRSRVEGLDFDPAEYVLTAFIQYTDSNEVIQCTSQNMGSLLPPVDNSDPLENLQPTALKLWPNPFRDYLTIELESRGKQNEVCQIFNLRGQVVQSFRIEGSGKQSLSWDAKDAAGKRLPAGLYFVKLSGGGRSQLQKALLLK